jgi:hypothetical protein
MEKIVMRSSSFEVDMHMVIATIIIILVASIKLRNFRPPLKERG